VAEEFLAAAAREATRTWAEHEMVQQASEAGCSLAQVLVAACCMVTLGEEVDDCWHRQD
jgi:hypothetical protein